MLSCTWDSSEYMNDAQWAYYNKCIYDIYWQCVMDHIDITRRMKINYF
jgi:hypothetical protein